MEAKVGMMVKYNAPGWENIVGMIYEIKQNEIVVDFGKRGFIGFTDGSNLLIWRIGL